MVAFDALVKALDDLTRHLIAMALVTGFFGVVFIALLGLVDIKDPAIATFVGTAAGYAIGKMDPILRFYFGDAGGGSDGDRPGRLSRGGDAPRV